MKFIGIPVNYNLNHILEFCSQFGTVIRYYRSTKTAKSGTYYCGNVVVQFSKFSRQPPKKIKLGHVTEREVFLTYSRIPESFKTQAFREKENWDFGEPNADFTNVTTSDNQAENDSTALVNEYVCRQISKDQGTINQALINADLQHENSDENVEDNDQKEEDLDDDMNIDRDPEPPTTQQTQIIPPTPVVPETQEEEDPPLKKVDMKRRAARTQGRFDNVPKSSSGVVKNKVKKNTVRFENAASSKREAYHQVDNHLQNEKNETTKSNSSENDLSRTKLSKTPRT